MKETFKSVNQMAQEEGESSRNEANRIRNREAEIRQSWRQIAYDSNGTPKASDIAERTGYPIEYVRFVCENSGHSLL